MQLQVTGEVWYWRGPAPFHFVTLPEPLSAQIRAVAPALTYGWGMIPVVATIGEITFETSMFRKNELYVVPIKNVVRHGEGIEVGDTVTIDLVMTPR
ncbi:DUF1905 domain-containing protein [Cellulomonas rhizosphaerae]|uniref:DUF1905 domain-containing protein n=1 Tax=Cellulomonas rhizosphaerae TaxID=2293719 RepID=A0A413RLJ8_9CELL|nr:DUF1905 domain-containing protein [Cellulomonas rhizosphaerae]RHA40750.1 DUF1905 domain-containing protein [Cellulomonas rhizosphaerae]